MIRSGTNLLLVLLLSSPAAAETVAIPADRDTTLIEQADGALGNGAGPVFFAGRTNQSNDGVRRALVSFDLAREVLLQSPVQIERVALVLTILPSNPAVREYRLHRVLSAWGEGGSASSGGGGAPAGTGDATWVHTFYPADFWPHNGGRFVGEPSARLDIGEPGVYRFQSERLTRDVALWATAPGSNFGWILIGDETARQTVKAFGSRENPDPMARPVLEITYRSVD